MPLRPCSPAAAGTVRNGMKTVRSAPNLHPPPGFLRASTPADHASLNCSPDAGVRHWGGDGAERTSTLISGLVHNVHTARPCHLLPLQRLGLRGRRSARQTM